MTPREQLAAKIYERVAGLRKQFLLTEPDYCRWEYLDDGQKVEALLVLDVYIEEIAEAGIIDKRPKRWGRFVPIVGSEKP